MKQIIRRYLTNNPRLKAARALKELMRTLPSITESEFKEKYTLWKNFWAETLNKRSQLESGKTQLLLSGKLPNGTRKFTGQQYLRNILTKES